MKDAGIEFEDIRYPHDATWPATSKELQKRGISRTGKVPVLEYNDINLSQVEDLSITSDGFELTMSHSTSQLCATSPEGLAATTEIRAWKNTVLTQ